MKSTLIDPRDGLRTFVLVLATGDEAVKSLTAFATEQRLAASHLTAIGAFSRAVVAYFDWSTKQYRHVPIDEQVEVLSLQKTGAMSGYMVDANKAVELLAARSPAAADWWRENCAAFLEANGCLIFPPDVCERL